jgi:hyperosmotically inducible protein
MKRLTQILFLLLAFALPLALCGCQEPGPAEKAGEKIDQGVEKAGDKINELSK